MLRRYHKMSDNIQFLHRFVKHCFRNVLFEVTFLGPHVNCEELLGIWIAADKEVVFNLAFSVSVFLWWAILHLNYLFLSFFMLFKIFIQTLKTLKMESKAFTSGMKIIRRQNGFKPEDGEENEKILHLNNRLVAAFKTFSATD